MNPVDETMPGNSHAADSSAQVSVSPAAEQSKGPDADFFVIGGIINITLITAYFIWAFRAWKRLDRKKTGANTTDRN